MFSLQQPSSTQIESFIESQKDRAFSYPAVGATKGTPPAGYRVDHNRVRLGEGAAIFGEACDNLRAWKHFDLGWVQLRPAHAPVAVGSTVALVVRHFRFWSLNACRIVYMIDEEPGDMKRFGFAYGTLPDHAETGEERFTIEWHPNDDSVWYDILAFSRPNKLAAKLGYPITRVFQRRFARDSNERLRSRSR